MFVCVVPFLALMLLLFSNWSFFARFCSCLLVTTTTIFVLVFALVTLLFLLFFLHGVFFLIRCYYLSRVVLMFASHGIDVLCALVLLFIWHDTTDCFT